MLNISKDTIVIVCGLPRSGTTAIFSLLRRAFPSCVSYPDESHFLSSASLIDELEETMGKFYEAMLVEDHNINYSPFGTKQQFIDNWFWLFIGSVNATNRRSFLEASTIDNNYKQEQEKYLLKSLVDLKDISMILKKPLAETSFSQLNRIFLSRKLVFIYGVGA